MGVYKEYVLYFVHSFDSDTTSNIFFRVVYDDKCEGNDA